jgi:hypothetical protein
MKRVVQHLAVDVVSDVPLVMGGLMSLCLHQRQGVCACHGTHASTALCMLLSESGLVSEDARWSCLLCACWVIPKQLCGDGVAPHASTRVLQCVGVQANAHSLVRHQHLLN